MLDFFSLPFFSNVGDYIACALAYVGIIPIVMAFGPQFVSIYKSKNSAIIPLDIFKFHLGTGIFLFIGSLFGIVGLISNPIPLARLAAFIFINGFLLFTCGYTFWLKITNAKKAKEMGISEEDFCKYYVHQHTKTK